MVYGPYSMVHSVHEASSIFRLGLNCLVGSFSGISHSRAAAIASATACELDRKHLLEFCSEVRAWVARDSARSRTK